MLNQAAHAAQNYGAPSSPQSGMAPQSGRGASVVSLTRERTHDPFPLTTYSIKNKIKKIVQKLSLTQYTSYTHTHTLR